MKLTFGFGKGTQEVDVSKRLLLGELHANPVTVELTEEEEGLFFDREEALDDTPETLHARIQVQEHIAFPEALAHLAAGRLRIEGRRVHIG